MKDPKPEGKPNASRDEAAKPADGGSERRFTRRQILGAGWSIPLIISIASPFGRADDATTPVSSAPTAHGDSFLHVDRDTRHVDGSTHFDETTPHLDGVHHIDQSDPHIDAEPHADHMPHVDTNIHNDTFPHADTLWHYDADPSGDPLPVATASPSPAD